MKTAEEMISEGVFFFDTKRTEYIILEPDVKDLMIEFAKIHVEAALKEVIANSAFNYSYETGGSLCFNDKDEILESYPLENIK